LFINVHSKRQRKKSSPIINLQCRHFDIYCYFESSNHISNVQNVRLQRRHRPTDDVSAHRAWKSTTGCSFNGTPLFAIASESPPHHACSISCLENGNSLINRLTPYFVDSQTFLPIGAYLVFFCCKNVFT